MRLPGLNWPPDLYLDVRASEETGIPPRSVTASGVWTEMVEPADEGDDEREFQFTADVVELARLRS